MNKDQQGFAHMAVIVIVMLAIVGGAATYVVKQNSDKKTNTTNSQSTETEKKTLEAALPSDLMSLENVTKLATEAAPEAKVVAVELEVEDGVFLYKVKLSDGKVLFFNAQNGQKVEKTDDDSEEEDGTLPAGFMPSISYDKAREIALAEHPGGVIEKIKLEMEEGKVVYSVRFADKARVDIDAESGSIVRTKASKKAESESKKSSSDDDSDDDNSTEQEDESEDDGDDNKSKTKKSGSSSDDSDDSDDSSSSSNDDSDDSDEDEAEDPEEDESEDDR